MELRGVRTSLAIIKGELIIEVEAPDHSAFRAAVNSVLRLLNTVLEVLEALKPSEGEHQ